MTLYGGSGAYDNTRLIGLLGMLSCSAAGSDDMGGMQYSAVNTRCMGLEVQDPQNPLFQVESKNLIRFFQSELSALAGPCLPGNIVLANITLQDTCA